MTSDYITSFEYMTYDNILSRYNPSFASIRSAYKNSLSDIFKNIIPRSVIYSGPCTIVFFEDGTKEIVRMCDKEKNDDREKAVLYAIVKHLYGKKLIEKLIDSAKDKRNEVTNEFFSFKRLCKLLEIETL